MNRTFLIARQEFIKYVTRRGFVISLLLFPLWITIVVLVPQWTSGQGSPRVFTVVDGTGGQYRDAILSGLQHDNEDRDLEALSRYAAANADESKLPPLTAAMLRQPLAPSSLRAFHKAGGTQEMLVALGPALRPGAPAFTPPLPRFVYHEPPAELARMPGGKNVARILRSDETPFDIETVVVIPPGFGPGAAGTAQFWTRQRNGDLRDFVTDALTGALRAAAVRRYAPQIDDPDKLSPAAALEQHNPEGDGIDTTIGSIVPIAFAIILFVVSVMNASVLLQGVVEEKSTRMIEVLLSCATAREITSGKLIGVIAVALTTLLIWGLALFGLMAIASHETATLVFASLSATASLQTLPLLLVYFLCGLLIYGSLFLAIGSMASSLADAQALLGPSMLILMLPNLMIAGIMRDPNGPLATVLSWVPVYTPYFMMLRIASHPPVWQVWGTLLLAVATTGLLIVWTGRVFARHVLTTERPPSLGALVTGLFRVRR